MCDFAVLAVLGDIAQLVIIELKSGVAYDYEIEQLVEGIRVLSLYFEENGLESRPKAYFVVGREVDKLRYSLRNKLASLRFSSRPVTLEILECG